MLIIRDVPAVEAVQATDLFPQHFIEGAVDTPEFVKGSADSGPQDPGQTTDVDGELHLDGQAHAGAGLGLMDEAGEEGGPETGLDLVLGNHPALTESKDFFAGGDDVPWLVMRQDIFGHQVDVAFSHLDKVGGDGMAGVPFAVGFNDNIFPLVGNKIHNEDILSCKGVKRRGRGWAPCL